MHRATAKAPKEQTSFQKFQGSQLEKKQHKNKRSVEKTVKKNSWWQYWLKEQTPFFSQHANLVLEWKHGARLQSPSFMQFNY